MTFSHIHSSLSLSLSLSPSLTLLIFSLQCNAAVGVKTFFDMLAEDPHKVMLFGDACKAVTDPIAKASRFFQLIQVKNAFSTIARSITRN